MHIRQLEMQLQNLPATERTSGDSWGDQGKQGDRAVMIRVRRGAARPTPNTVRIVNRTTYREKGEQMTDIVERLTEAIDFFIQPPPPKLPPPNDPIDILLSDARSEIERLRKDRPMLVFGE